MRSSMKSGWWRAALMALALALGSAPAVAQDSPPPKKQRKASGTLSEGTYRQLERIHELIGKNRNGEALEKGQALLGRVSGDYEKAMVYQTMGFIYGSQNNFKQAIAMFEQAVSLEALPQQPYEEMLYNLGQMYYANDQHEKALVTLERFMAETSQPIKPEAHILVGSIYAEKKRFREALGHVEKAIAGAKTAPKESWLQLKLALHFELKEWAQCAEVLVSLISLVPAKEDYWKQLHSVFFEIKRDQEALATLAIAERQGFVKKENEVRNLANVYFLLDIPYKAGEVLQKGLDQKVLQADEKTLTTLADAWMASREYERAEAVLKRAAQISSKGDIYFRLGQIYVEDEKWKPALESLGKALEKGATKAGDAYFLAGVAAFNAGDPDRALGYLQKATGYEETRKNAVDWMGHVRDQLEIKRQQVAAEAEMKQINAEAAKAAAEAEKRNATSTGKN